MDEWSRCVFTPQTPASLDWAEEEVADLVEARGREGAVKVVEKALCVDMQIDSCRGCWIVMRGSRRSDGSEVCRLVRE